MAKKKRKKEVAKDPVVKELQAIKRLLMLCLLNQEVDQKVIAYALQMDAADVSRMMPVRKIKRALAT
ncbi:MAG: hypothetical protein ACYTBX_09105 [Planctomycetota bacterium]|jgi:hypothetical protein